MSRDPPSITVKPVFVTPLAGQNSEALRRTETNWKGGIRNSQPQGEQADNKYDHDGRDQPLLSARVVPTDGSGSMLALLIPLGNR